MRKEKENELLKIIIVSLLLLIIMLITRLIIINETSYEFCYSLEEERIKICNYQKIKDYLHNTNKNIKEEIFIQND